MSNSTHTATTWPVTGSSPRIPEGGRRNPIVFVDLMIGDDWGTTVAVQHQYKGGLVIRLPMSPDGSPGVRPSAPLMDAMTAAALAAVKADRAAFEHLTMPHPAGQLRKVGGLRPKPDPESAA